jgi:cation:H+ antiporter
VAVGLTALVVAGRSIVVGAEGVGERFGWSDFVVGALLVAVATSMPELVTVLVSIRRGHTDLGVGTLVGSNIFNTMFIVGVASVISEIDVDGSAVAVTLLLGAAACVLMWPWRGSRLGRWQGAVLVGVFGAHLIATASIG